MPYAYRVRGPVLQGLRDPGAGSQDGGPAPVPRLVVETHPAAGTPGALRLSPLPPSMETERLGPCPAAGAADPLGSRVRAACSCPGVHVHLTRRGGLGDLLAHRQQCDPDLCAEQAITGDSHRFDGVEVLGIDDCPCALRSRVGDAPCVWRTPGGATNTPAVVIDLRRTPSGGVSVSAGRGPGPVQEGSQDLTLPARPGLVWRGEVVTINCFRGLKAPPVRSSPRPGRSWIPIRVVSLAAGKLDQCHSRIQRAIAGCRGRADDPLCRARRNLRTRADLLTDAQAERVKVLFVDERRAPVHATWGVYQSLIQAYRTEGPGLGKYLMQRLVGSLKQAVPDGLEEIQTQARTLAKRDTDILAYSDGPGSPTVSPRPSTDAWSTYMVSPWASVTSPTIPSAVSSTPDA